MAPMPIDLADTSYDAHGFGAEWWRERAEDGPHRRAYRAVADDLAAALGAQSASLIVDYACGPGLLMRSLAKVFPNATIAGLDESIDCLVAAGEVLKGARLGSALRHGRLRLERVALPEFSVPVPQADAAIFCFPDFRSADIQAFAEAHKDAFRDDWRLCKAAAKRLAKDEPDIAPCREDLFLKRLAFRDCQRRVRPGGLIIRVDYAAANRDDCVPAYAHAMAVEEGSGLVPKMKLPKGMAAADTTFTSLLGSTYRRSAVMEDVYAQTGDPTDRDGGFMVGVLRTTTRRAHQA